MFRFRKACPDSHNLITLVTEYNVPLDSACIALIRASTIVNNTVYYLVLMHCPPYCPGGIKRHHFRRGQMTHGSKSHRALGSIGAGTTPGRVYKGKKMPGRMGGTKTKIRKLKVVKIDNDLRVVMIKGALPGKPGNLLRVAPAKIVGKNIPKN